MKEKYINILGEKFKINPIYYGKKAIVGDYNEITANITKNVLKYFGIKAYIFKSSTDILKEIKKNHYDLIITNYLYHNDIDGLTLINKLNEIKSFSTPIIITSVNNNLDCDNFILKPITIEKIKPLLEKYLKK